MTDPLDQQIILSRYYFQKLDADGLHDLYDTITHESLHRGQSRFVMMLHPLDHPEIYKEAGERAMKFYETHGEDTCACGDSP